MLNKIFLMGRLTRDPEMRHTQNGTAVASFSIAVDRDFKDKQSGEKVTDFVDIVAWRSTAEFVDKYFSKGRMAVVEGRLQIRDWTDKDGNKRRSAEVVADSIYFGDSKRDGDSGGTYHSSGRSSGVNVSASDFTELGDDDGELLPNGATACSATMCMSLRACRTWPQGSARCCTLTPPALP